MTFFPSPDPEKIRSAMSQSQSLIHTQLPSTKPRDEWTNPFTTTQDTMPLNHTLTWSAYEPHGLGPLTFPGTTGSMHTTTVYDGFPNHLVPTRPLELAYQHAITNPDGTWRHHPSDDCNAGSICTPAALWDPQQQTAPSSVIAGNASPNLSEYSTSTWPSAISSPYAPSDSYVRAAGSPMVKLEESLDHFTSRMLFTNERPALQQTMLVNPEDLVSQQSSVFEVTDAASTNPSLDASTDLENSNLKKRGRPQRPPNRKAFSSDDIRAEILEGRQKRGYTKPENASCACDWCGKLFQRTYNLKAHMDTHDPRRVQPHVCLYPGCDKRFVRRTDLIRHEQSVHLKSRNYACSLCGSSFARKDTLRRHMEDGCQKRPEFRKRGTRIKKEDDEQPAFQHSNDYASTL